MKKFSCIRGFGYRKLKKEKRGSIFVEGAIFLPIFLVSILTLGFLIKQVGMEETLIHAMVNQGRLASVMAYSSEEIKVQKRGAISEEISGEKHRESASDMGLALLFETGLRLQIEKEWKLEGSVLKLNRFRSLYQEDGRDQLMEAVVEYRMPIPLPKAVENHIEGKQRLVFRAFTGRKEQKEPVSVEKMETLQESRIVLVFPRAGERYHGKGCITVTSTPIQKILSKALRKKYESCSLCHSEKLGNGCAVYCFTSYGGAYHRALCRSVDKYFISLEREEAEKKGYTPCMKCGGE